MAEAKIKEKVATVKAAEVKPEVKAEVKPAAEPVKAEAKEVVKTETAEVKKETAKPAAKKAPAKKAPVKKAAAKPAAKKAAAEKKAPAEKKTTAKAAKEVVTIQFGGKSYTTEDLVKSAKDVWQYDLKQKASDFKSVELYVKPEEGIAYYVVNKDITGSFFI